MRNRVFLFTIIIFSIIQVTILDSIKILNVKPDLLLISMVIAALYFELKWALFLGIFAGLLKDTLSINTFGISILLFPLWSFLIIKLSKKISMDNNFICAVFVFFIMIFNTIITRLILLFFGKSSISLGIFVRIAFIESLYTALIWPLLLRTTRALILKSK